MKKVILALSLMILSGVLGWLVATRHSNQKQFDQWLQGSYHWNVEYQDGRKYAYLLEGGIAVNEYDAIVESLPYEEITMERTGCFGTCPAYSVSLSKSGSARYEGQAYTSMGGAYTGTVSFFDFAHLCNALEHFNFIGMDDDYEASWTDDSSTTVALIGRGTNVVKSVHEYGRVGPIELWVIQSSIDAVIAKIDWTQTHAPSDLITNKLFGEKWAEQPVGTYLGPRH